MKTQSHLMEGKIKSLSSDEMKILYSVSDRGMQYQVFTPGEKEEELLYLSGSSSAEQTDELLVFHRALAWQEVQELYNRTGRKRVLSL